MSASKKLDYKSLGLKAGIEIHQQLKTKRKLFCRCPAELTTDDPDFTVMRNFRPVLGEMGVFDEAMLLEFKKQNSVIYQGYNDINCTYELDDTPPFECDPNAIQISLELAKLLNMEIIDEFKVCRKNYLDGSVPGGFQRTMIVAKDGHYTLSNGKEIGIEILCLEEDSARRIAQDKKSITFRLDRLGIPLVEIATAPDIKGPEEAREAAARLGLLLRSTGNVRRGLGVTRQDLNVSIKEGARIEIKGVQKLDWIPILVEREAMRQLKLVELRDEMKKRGISTDIIESIDIKGVDLSKDLKDTKVKFIKNGIKKKQKLMGIKVPKMEGLIGLELQPDRRFGTELSDRIKVIVKLSGIIHSDEKLTKYGFSEKEISLIKKKLNASNDDAFILILGPKNKLLRGFPVIVERIQQALNGVPPETRKALENGNSEFLRGLHGGSRLYPDTDSRSILIDPTVVEKIEPPPKPWDIIKEMHNQYDLDEDRVEQLILDGYLGIFNEIIEKIKVSPSIVLNTFLDTLTAISRDGYEIENINDNHFIDLFAALAKKQISKEAIDELLMKVAKNPSLTIQGAAKSLNISAMKVEDLKEIIDEIIKNNHEIIKERGEKAFQPLMGDVMREARGKIDGKIVARELKKAVKEALK